MTVTRRIRSPGRARNKPLKPLRAGMPGESGEPSVTTLVCSLHHSHARLRVHWALGIPHALRWAERLCTTRALAPRGYEGVSEVFGCLKIEFAGGATSYGKRTNPFTLYEVSPIPAQIMLYGPP